MELDLDDVSDMTTRTAVLLEPAVDHGELMTKRQDLEVQRRA